MSLPLPAGMQINAPVLPGFETVLTPEDTVVVARGIEQFFARVFAAEGRYYFDDPAFTPDDSLSRLL